MGDCGAWRNIADVKSTSGYINTNTKPSNYTLLDNGLNKRGQDYSLNLKKDVKPIVVGRDFYEKPSDSIEQLIKREADYIEQTTEWSMEDFVWQYITEGEVDYFTRHTAFCSVWVNPEKSNCELCNTNPNKPCSEYRCMSLGKGCYYEESNGYGICKLYDKYSADKRKPKVEIDLSKLSKNLSVEKDYFLDYDGWYVKQGVNPGNLVTFGVITDKETQCTLSFFPGYEAFAIPMFTSNFSKEHEFRLRIPDLDLLIETIKDYTQIFSILPLSKLEEYESIFNKMKKDAHETASNFAMDTTKLDSEISNMKENIMMK
jgi:hypothetical protein